MEPNSVAIIDNGINHLSFINIPSPHKKILIDKDCKVIITNQSYSSEITHGTICAAIIEKYSPQTPIIDISIYDQGEKTTDVKRLMKAIEHCYEIGIKYINISLGSVAEIKPQVKNKIEHIVRQGTVIVASSNANGVSAFPSNIHGVISVDVDRAGKCDGKEYLTFGLSAPKIDFVASGTHVLRKQDRQIYITNGSSSFAAPVIMANIINSATKWPKNFDTFDIKKELILKSKGMVPALAKS